MRSEERRTAAPPEIKQADSDDDDFFQKTIRDLTAARAPILGWGIGGAAAFGFLCIFPARLFPGLLSRERERESFWASALC